MKAPIRAGYQWVTEGLAIVMQRSRHCPGLAHELLKFRHLFWRKRRVPNGRPPEHVSNSSGMVASYPPRGLSVSL